MKYFDPSPATCKCCSNESMQPVSDLLSLVATCPKCNTSLDDIGIRMREGLDDWGSYCTLIELVIGLERVVGKTIVDEELTAVRTLRDLAQVVAVHLPSEMNSQSKSISLVLEAARDICHDKPDDTFFDLCSGLRKREIAMCNGDRPKEISIDLRIIDALFPNRWLR